MSVDTERLAATIVEARGARSPVTELMGAGDGNTLRDAFRVQQEVVRRLVERGDRPVGFKLGNIAKAMQDKFGVDEPDYGYLLASQFLPEGLPVPAADFIEPFVELEPAFILKKDLGGPTVTVADVISAVEYTVPALEIIDSRVKDWNIGIHDTLADLGSCGAVIIGGPPRRLHELNLADTAGEVRFDGEIVATGNTKAVYGNPLSALMWLCRRVAEYGVSFKAGDFILPGSCLAAEKLTLGPDGASTEVTGSFAGWGEVSFQYSPGI